MENYEIQRSFMQLKYDQISRIFIFNKTIFLIPVMKKRAVLIRVHEPKLDIIWVKFIWTAYTSNRYIVWAINITYLKSSL